MQINTRNVWCIRRGAHGGTHLFPALSAPGISVTLSLACSGHTCTTGHWDRFQRKTQSRSPCEMEPGLMGRAYLITEKLCSRTSVLELTQWPFVYFRIILSQHSLILTCSIYFCSLICKLAVWKSLLCLFLRFLFLLEQCVVSTCRYSVCLCCWQHPHVSEALNSEQANLWWRKDYI